MLLSFVTFKSVLEIQIGFNPFTTFNILLSQTPEYFTLTPDNFTRQCRKSHRERVRPSQMQRRGGKFDQNLH